MKALSERLADAIRMADPAWTTAPLLQEAAELARRVEGAPEGEVCALHPHEVCIDKFHAAHGMKTGQRVRIVPEVEK